MKMPHTSLCYANESSTVENVLSANFSRIAVLFDGMRLTNITRRDDLG